MISLQFKKKLSFSSSVGYLEIDQKISAEEFVVLFGKSGAGKTSFLKIVAGLINPEDGIIEVNKEVWFDKRNKINVSPQKRNIGFVFQDYALFPNMTIAENIKFAQDKKDKSIFNEIVEICGIRGLLDRKPNSLSGGQKQRIALARAVAKKPAILILDEPLSALDGETRLILQNELAEIHKTFKLTTIMVSHDIAEIAKLADRVLVLEEGKIKEHGEPVSIFSKGKVSGKVKIIGEIIKIVKEDVVYIVTVASGNNIIKAIATEEDKKDLLVGDKVMLSSKAFNPIIMKI